MGKENGEEKGVNIAFWNVAVMRNKELLGKFEKMELMETWMKNGIT